MINIKHFSLLSLLFLGACAYGSFDLGDGKYSQASAITGQGGVYKVGNPYKIMGKWYYPKEDYSYSEVGTASWYGKDFHAKKTANGEKYDMNSLTAAHRTLPLPSIVKVTNLENGRSLVLRVNDRGPYAKNRIIDVSRRASQLLGFQTQGTTKVRVEVMEKESRALKAALTGEDCYMAEAAPVQPVIKEVEDETKSEVKKYAVEKEGFYVQLGSFSMESGAQRLASQVDVKTNIYAVNVDGQDYYRVRMGPYFDEREAEVALSEVRHKGVYDAKIVSE